MVCSAERGAVILELESEGRDEVVVLVGVIRAEEREGVRLGVEVGTAFLEGELWTFSVPPE